MKYRRLTPSQPIYGFDSHIQLDFRPENIKEVDIPENLQTIHSGFKSDTIAIEFAAMNSDVVMAANLSMSVQNVAEGDSTFNF